MRKYVISLGILGIGILLGAGLMRLLNKPEWTQANLTPLKPQQIVLGKREGNLQANVPLTALNGVFRNVATTAKPAVVFIEVASEASRMPNDATHQPWFRPNGEHEVSSGSGVIVSQEGYIITNHHVIENASSIRVILENRQEFIAELIGSDRTTDLAVLKIPAHPSLSVISVATTDDLAVGDWVVAIGSPFRLTSTVTTGIVSALNRQIGIIDNDFGVENFIQTDAAINRGNSGGALLDLKGNLVGINAAIATETGNYEGYGFAIPVSLALRVAQDLIAYGKVRRGYMGLMLGMMTDSRSQQVGLPDIQGVMVDRVLPGSAAERGGVQSGDVILALNGMPVNAPNQLQNEVLMRRPGERIKLRIWRNGREKEIQLTLLENVQIGNQLNAPKRKPNRSSLTQDWGLEVLPLTQSLKKDFNVQQGVYVQDVVSNSIAALAEIGADCIITKVENQSVNSPVQLLDVLQSYAATQSQIVIKTQKRSGETVFYTLDLSE